MPTPTPTKPAPQSPAARGATAAAKSNVIEIPADLYRRLQALAIPLEDTVLTVIERAVTCYEHQQPRPNGDLIPPESDRQPASGWPTGRLLWRQRPQNSDAYREFDRGRP